MNAVYIVNKPIGKTPLQMITQLKTVKPELKDTPITYAGRLDPLAHGVLILLAGDAIESRNTYLELTKEYMFTVLFGVETDTYDYLGMLTNNKYRNPGTDVKSYVNSFVNGHIGNIEQQYPPYSSKPVQGKPLFQWAREGKIQDIIIPTHPIKIHKFACLTIDTIQKDALHHEIRQNISLVKGDFRQDLIMQKWNEFFINTESLYFTTATFSITCSSGTYVRSLAHELGSGLGYGAIAIDIERTAVGNYSLADCMDLTS
jgi:tRNA pseudouridine55 synthase